MVSPEKYQFMADPIRHHAQVRGDKAALIFEGREISYRQLDQRSNQVANGLLAAGVEPGQRVAILAKNIDLFFEIYYGATKAGAVLVPVNFRLAAPEVAFVLNDAAAKVLFVTDEYHDLVAAIADELSTVSLIVSLTVTSQDGRDDWPAHVDWRDAQNTGDPHREGSAEATALQPYSSGTTGHPKGVEMTHQNFVQFVPHALADWGDWMVEDVSLVAMPLFHVGGCVWGFIGLYVGTTNILLPEVDPPVILKAIERHGITQVFFVPAVILFLLQTPGAAETDVSSVRHVMYGASPIPYPVLQRAVKMFNCGFAQLYGLTETTGAVTYLAPEDHDGGEKMKSCGKPMRAATVRVVDAHDQDCPPGTVGEIIVSGNQVMKGYWNLAAETAKAIRNGWFYSGDAGYFDGDGYLYIHDRVKDMIVSGGENIYPAEVESALAGHEGIADVAVIGVPDEKWGETVKAIIVVKPGETLTAEEVMTFARARIGGFKIPRSVDFMDELPRNPSGKILKRVLREPYWRGHDRQVN